MRCLATVRPYYILAQSLPCCRFLNKAGSSVSIKRPPHYSSTSRTIWLKIGLSLSAALMGPSCWGAQTPKNVLILFEGNANHPANAISYGVFQEAFGSDQANQIFEEYIDEDRLGPSDEILGEMFKRKYAGRKMDLIIGDGLPVLRFLLQRGERLWPGTPKVFYFVDRRELPPTLPPDMTGVAMSLDFGAILDLALRLEPTTHRAFYVGGVNAWEETWRGFSEQDFKRFRGRVEINYLNDLPLPDLLDHLNRLPNDSVVIYSELLRDASGRVYAPARACPLIASASNAPVYGPFDIYVGCGIVGGVMINDKDIAEQTVRLSVRVLERGTASGFPIESAQTRVVVDWQQLQRWKISEATLPPGTVVRFRPPTLWEQYKWFLVAGLAAMTAQLVLIVILAVEMRRRRKSDLAIKALTGRLINAGEEERKRIARELHDDIGQRLSLVSMGLNLLNRDGTTDNGRIHRSLKESLQLLDDLVTDVHNLSHQLHSRKLKVLGLEVALKEICRQVAKQHDLEIPVTADRFPSSLPEDIALCFYRVAQEALNNCVKHSRTSRVDVNLTAHNGTLRMKIKDYGSGFDPAAMANGLGLATMRERLRLVGGNFLVRSKPGEGTELTAQVKLTAALADITAA